MQTKPGQTFQYLPGEPEETNERSAGARVKDAAGTAAAQVKEALPEPEQVKEAAGKAVAQVKEALPEPEPAGKAVAQVKAILPDAEQIKDEFMEATHRLLEILPDGDDLRAMLQRTVDAVRNDPTIKAHIEAGADIVAERVETTVGSGIDTVTGKAKTVVDKVGLEPLEYVAERIGEIAKEGVEELVQETKSKALN